MLRRTRLSLILSPGSWRNSERSGIHGRSQISIRDVTTRVRDPSAPLRDRTAKRARAATGRTMVTTLVVLMERANLAGQAGNSDAVHCGLRRSIGQASSDVQEMRVACAWANEGRTEN